MRMLEGQSAVIAKVPVIGCQGAKVRCQGYQTCANAGNGAIALHKK